MPQGAWECYLVPAVKPRPAWVLSVGGGKRWEGRGEVRFAGRSRIKFWRVCAWGWEQIGNSALR